jgi:hypothetical protein
LELQWFFGVGGGGQIPVLGRVGLVPPAPAGSQKSRALREVLIPFQAWAMYCTFVDVERELNQMEPGRQRPIVAEATGDAFIFRLTTYLMQPLLATEKLGIAGLIITSEGAAQASQSLEQHRQWIDRLNGLGLMWRSTLPWATSRRTSG